MICGGHVRNFNDCSIFTRILIFLYVYQVTRCYTSIHRSYWEALQCLHYALRYCHRKKVVAVLPTLKTNIGHLKSHMETLCRFGTVMRLGESLVTRDQEDTAIAVLTTDDTYVDFPGYIYDHLCNIQHRTKARMTVTSSMLPNSGCSISVGQVSAPPGIFGVPNLVWVSLLVFCYLQFILLTGAQLFSQY